MKVDFLRRLGRLAAIFALTLSMSGCYSSYVYRSSAAPSNAGTTVLVHTFIYGIVSLNGVDLDYACGDREVYSVHSRIGGIGIVASTLTMGLWAPMSVTVVCSQTATSSGMTELPLPDINEKL